MAVPEMDASAREVDICVDHIRDKINSIRLARHKKLKTGAGWGADGLRYDCGVVKAG